jgi:hypothetical protein
MRLRPTVLASVVTLALLAPAGAARSQTMEPAPVLAEVTGKVLGPTSATRVLAISVDGLNTDAIRKLGRDGAPAFHRMIDEGASTLNARTEFEQTVTLPNHTSMMTGRRIDRDLGGHGVTWDDDRRRMTVQKGAGHPVSSIFNVTHADGGLTALFSTKEKFALYDRSWPRAIDRFTTDEDQPALVRAARRDLVRSTRTFTFLHMSLPDQAGHAYGGMTPQYLDAVRATDRLLGTLLAAVDRHAELARDLVVVLTADHGFAPGVRDHSARRRLANYRIPFLVWGAGVGGADLYALNADYRDPGTRRPGYVAARQPVRNGDVANLAADLLGLAAVPGSELDAAEDLDVVR